MTTERERQIAEAERERERDIALIEEAGLVPPEPKPEPEPVPKPEVEPLTPAEIIEEAGLKPPPPPVVVKAEPTPEPEAPTTPDKPGGQIATVDGEELYIAGSTMHKKGFRTQKEYIEAQARGATSGIHEGILVPKDSIIMTTKAGEPYARYKAGEIPSAYADLIEAKQYKIPVLDYLGKRMFLTGKQATKLSEAKGEEQYKLAIKYKLVPKDSKYVQEKEDKWSYIPEWSKQKAQAVEAMVLSKALKEVMGDFAYKKGIITFYDLPAALRAGVTPTRLKEFGFDNKKILSAQSFAAKHILLGDKTWILLEDFNKYSSEIKAIGKEKGFKAMNEAIGKAGEVAFVMKQERAKAENLATAIKGLDDIASSGFFEKGGKASDRVALADAMRRAGFKDPSIDHYNKLSIDEKIKVSKEYYKRQSFTGDVALELLTFGQAKTASFNKKDIERQYNKETTLIQAIYRGQPSKIDELYKDKTFDPGEGRYLRYLDARTYAKESKGIEPAESEQEFIDRTVGDKAEYVERVLEAQPTLAETAKEFIPFYQFTPAQIKKYKETGDWSDFVVRTLFDIALVLPVAGWITKGTGVGIRSFSIGGKVANLGGKAGTTGVYLLRNEARTAVLTVAREITTKREAVKLAEQALKRAIAKKSVDIGLRREAVIVVKAELKDAISQHSARLATARSNYKVLDELFEAARKNPTRTAVGERAYNIATGVTRVLGKATTPAWYAYGSSEVARTLAQWEELSALEKTISLSMAGIAFGIPGKVAGAVKSGYEMTTDIGRIPRRAVDVPEVYLPGEAGMPKTSIRGMTPKQQLAAMKTSAKAMEDLWAGKGKAKYPWGATGLTYAPRSEFQKIIPRSMISATPAGEVFKSPIYKVVTLREPAQYFAPWGFAKFTEVSAVGVKGAQPAFLVLFGEKIGTYPKFVGLARTPAEMQRLILELLRKEALAKQAYPGFKLYRKAKEPEFIVPTGTEIGAGRSLMLGRVYGGVPLWTRATPFGKKIELQPHFILDEAGARRTGFSISEAFGLKGLALKAELKHWIEKAQVWRRGIAAEEIALPKLLKTRKARIRAYERDYPTIRNYHRSMNKEIAKAEKAGNKALADKLTKMRDSYLVWFDDIERDLAKARNFHADLRTRATPETRRLLRDLRAIESLRRASIRTVAIRTLERIREEARASRVEIFRVKRPLRKEAIVRRLTTPRRRTPARTRTARIIVPRLRVSRVARLEEIRAARVRPEPVRPERIRPEPTRPEPVRLEPEKPPPPPPPPPPPLPTKPVKPPIKPPIITTQEVAKEKIARAKGALAWRQGEVTRKGKRVPVWYVILSPYKSEANVLTMLEKPTRAKVVANRVSAYDTIQQLTGKAPAFVLTLDLGIMDIAIDEPEPEPGKPTAIKFTADPRQETRSMIRLAKPKGLKIRKPKKRKVSKRRKSVSPSILSMRR